MNAITKNNLKDFLNKYQNFHDGNIINIEYNIFKENIEIFLSVYNYINEPKKTKFQKY